jgi:hypothetical protein
VLGIFNGNKFEYIFTDFINFTPLVFLVLDNNNFKNKFLSNNLEGLNKLLPFLIITSISIFIYMGYDLTSTLIARFAYDSDSKLSLFAPLTPIFFIPFLICFDKTLYNRLFVYIGAVLILLMGFITQTKTVFIPTILAFLLRIFFGGGLSSKLKYIFFLLLISGLLISLAYEYMPETIISFTDKFNSTNDSNIDRIDESWNYLKQCNILQLFFGKGYGGVKIFNNEDFIGGINMIHFGIVHLIMKGGIILFLLMYLPLFYIIINDFIGRQYAYVSMAFVFMSMDLGHTQWISLTSMLMYWTLVYFRFYKKLKLQLTLA